jgi:Raf kinase inhibitor-like YbhB/YbcL family protein
MMMTSMRARGGSRLRLGACAAVAILCAATNNNARSASQTHFTLTSSGLQLAISVPLLYTAKAFGCSGGNMSPPLQWSGAPAGTKSFVMTLFDRDERSTPSGWWHWVVYDLPGNVDKLSAGAGAEHSQLLPAETRQGRTDLGEDAFMARVAPREIPHIAMSLRYTH